MKRILLLVLAGSSMLVSHAATASEAVNTANPFPMPKPLAEVAVMIMDEVYYQPKRDKLSIRNPLYRPGRDKFEIRNPIYYPDRDELIINGR